MATNHTTANATTNDNATVTVRVRTWGTSVAAYADRNGMVRVWDPIAKHFTAWHNLSASQERTVRAKATRCY